MKIGYSDIDIRLGKPAIEIGRKAEALGYDSLYFAGGGRDSAMLATLTGHSVPRLRVGSSIVSVWQNRPLAMAETAIIANEALDGRFVLGLGLSHPHMVVDRLGMKFERPILYLREYLTILMQCLDDHKADYDGELLSAHAPINIQYNRRPQVLIAALGPQALRVAGRLSDGTMTFMVPLRSLEELTIPIASQAAQEVGRPRPHFLASLPICVPADKERARADAAQTFINYGSGYYPSYRAALDRAEVAGPDDVAIFGTEEEVAQALGRYRDIGIDEIYCVPFGTPEERAATFEFLPQLSEYNAAGGR
ncbi:TIGR03564 family F420-dependent LLM class oxidoreductase [soil metagenome]